MPGQPDNHRRIAVVCDARSGGFFKSLMEELSKLKSAGVDYRVLFLDADDEFEEGLLGKVDGALREDQQIDMLHFGIRVIGEGVSDESCSSFESFVNQPVETLEGVDILRRYSGAAARIVRIGGCRKGHSRHACSRMLSRRCPFSVLIARKTLSRCS